MNRSFRDRTNLSKSEMNFGIAPHKAGRGRKTERERPITLLSCVNRKLWANASRGETFFASLRIHVGKYCEYLFWRRKQRPFRWMPALRTLFSHLFVRLLLSSWVWAMLLFLVFFFFSILLFLLLSCVNFIWNNTPCTRFRKALFPCACNKKWSWTQLVSLEHVKVFKCYFE